MHEQHTRGATRVRLAAEEVGASLTDEAETRLGREVEQIEHWLAPRWWIHDPAAGTWPDTEFQYNDWREAANKIPQAIERHLTRADLSTNGGAYTFIDVDGARAAAEQLVDQEKALPLAGMTFAVKDMIAVAGHSMRAGSAVREHAPAELADAPIVTALRKAGAVFLGTTSLHEFAFGVTGVNQYAGTSLNPHDKQRIAGGSSSGSAVAVAQGSANIAVGTDTGGSVRIPAALCGVVGFKPAFGTYPLSGVFPLSPTLDHLGLIADSVREIALVHGVLGFGRSKSRRPARVGFIPSQVAQTEPPVRSAVERVIEALADGGREVAPITWPSHDEIHAVSTVIMYAEAAAVHYESLLQHANLYGSDVRNRLLQGLSFSARAYVAAREQRRRLRRSVLDAIAEVECIIGPTVGMLAPTLPEALDATVAARLVQFTRIGNLTGLPALSLPLPQRGLPVGLQIIARDNVDALGFGLFFEDFIV